MTSRRSFISFLAGGLYFPMARAFGQAAGKAFRLGYLQMSSEPGGREFFSGIRDELAKQGYVEGRNIVFVPRYADGQAKKLPELAAEIARENVDVIIAGGPAIVAAINATSRIPIVMAFSPDDPVKSGFVKSLARPGTNVTGITAQVRDFAPKWVEVLREVAPGIERVAALSNPAQPEHAIYTRVLQDHLPAGMRLQIVEVDRPRQYDDAFANMAKERAEGLIILGNPVFTEDSARLADLALSRRLVSIYLFKEFPAAGGLMSYGPDHREIFDLAAQYVDKIFKGVDPAELAVQQPTKFDLVLNMKTAMVLGLRIPPSILIRATVIR